MDKSTHTLNATSYDAIAQRYHAWSLSHQANVPTASNPRLFYLDNLLSLLPSPTTATVLDLGCGSGVPGTQILARRCHKGKVVGVDSSSAMIELAKTYVSGEEKPDAEAKDSNRGNGTVQGVEQDGKGGRNEVALAEVELKVAGMTDLDFPPQSFDAVVAFYSVIHLPRDELKGLLEQIAKWLVKTETDRARQGYLLLNLGVTDNPGAYDKEWLGSSEGHMFWSSFDEATNLKMVEEAGFEVVESAVVEDKEDEKVVPFLWVLAKKKYAEDEQGVLSSINFCVACVAEMAELPCECKALLQ